MNACPRAIVTLLLAVAGMAHAAVGGDCTWREPGHDPYRGSSYTAIMAFSQISYVDRLELVGKVRLGMREDIAAIGQSGIAGKRDLIYGAAVRDMHFGYSRRCASVSRAGWAPDHIEVADVYRVGNKCALRPHVCGNWAWTTCDLAPAAGLQKMGQAPEPGTISLVLAAIGAVFAISGRINKRP